MKVVLDTNVLLVAISRKSLFYPIYEAFLNNVYEVYLTTPILLEYEEIFELRANKEVAKSVVEMLLVKSNVYLVDKIYYKWLAIPNDPDDDKFVDCAVLANADYLVTNDLHFNLAKKCHFRL